MQVSSISASTDWAAVEGRVITPTLLMSKELPHDHAHQQLVSPLVNACDGSQAANITGVVWGYASTYGFNGTASQVQGGPDMKANFFLNSNGQQAASYRLDVNN